MTYFCSFLHYEIGCIFLIESCLQKLHTTSISILSTRADIVKISRKLEYAFRVMAQLGRYYERGALVNIEALSEAERIPSNYLVQILNELRLSGIIHSKRGKQGGYALAKSPDQISLFSIVDSVDPEFLKASYEKSGQSGGKVSQFWSQISEQLIKDLSDQSLESLMGDEVGSMYYI